LRRNRSPRSCPSTTRGGRLLAIRWTSHDYVNHFGPESRQSHDQTIRLDRVFGELFAFIDHRIGLQNVLITLSADHGFMNIPEFSASRRRQPREPVLHCSSPPARSACQWAAESPHFWASKIPHFGGGGDQPLG
jgi:Type I phosphodiesterase / nucleotide pyrophosphatase